MARVKFGGNRVGRFRPIDQPPRHDDLLIGLASPLKIGDGDLAIRPLRNACRNSLEVSARI